MQCQQFIRNIIVSLIKVCLISNFMLVSTASAFAAGAANNDSSTAEANKRVWNLQDADIRSVIEQVSLETGRNFVIDSRVNGKVTVVSHKPIGPDEVYQVFLAVLKITGYSAVESNGVVQIVPDAAARSMGLPLVGSEAAEHNPDMVVQVIPVKHVSAQALVPVLRPLISPQGGHMSGYGPSNTLIVADRADTIARMQKIIDRIDIDDSSEMEVINLQHAIPSEVVNVLNSIVNSRRPGDIATGNVTLSADDRSNTIIMSGDKQKRLKVRAVIANLDVEAPGAGNTQVIYVKYQRAEDLVKVIVNVINSYFGANRGSQQQQNQQPAAAVLGAMRNAGASHMGRNEGSGKASEIGAGIQAEQREAVGTVIGGFGVQSEPNLNALVVTAPQPLMRIIKSIVAKLDVRRPQVLVEAIVVELEDQSVRDFGLDWRLGGAGVGGFSAGSGTGSLHAIQGLLNDGKEALLNPGLSVGIMRNGSLRGLLSALESDTGSNILATPSVVALDNGEAKIFVGERVPFKTGTSVSEGGVQSNTISREDVGLGLAIVPQITMDEAIVLSIEQTADTIVPNTDSGDGLTQTTTNRLINTKVIVNNGDVLVLGGLIRSQEDTVKVKVPVLGDLPLLGNLFKTNHKTMKKRNLMVFLRPTIMRDSNDSIRVTGSKYDFMRDKLLVNQYGENYRKLGLTQPEMPNLEQPAGANIPDPFAGK